MRSPRFLLFVAFVLFVDAAAARAEEPFFQKGDVIAIVGGEDMVALSEYGYLELLLTRALPDFHLRFRNLAWEGDTVFEQRRDLNFPPWEEQLEKIGATVVLCQFGQMESLAGKEQLPEFIAAYEKLLARFSGGGKRRVVVIAPNVYDSNDEDATPSVPYKKLPYHLALRPWNERIGPFYEYVRATDDLSKRHQWVFLDWYTAQIGLRGEIGYAELTRDGVHMSEEVHLHFGKWVSTSLLGNGKPDEIRRIWTRLNKTMSSKLMTKEGPKLLDLILAKNRLWFDYWRVQNWAFLAGDRTNQPSSRDHLDPAKRWFPAERERFLPLIEAREKEIDTLAQKLAQP